MTQIKKGTNVPGGVELVPEPEKGRTRDVVGDKKVLVVNIMRWVRQ